MYAASSDDNIGSTKAILESEELFFGEQYNMVVAHSLFEQKDKNVSK